MAKQCTDKENPGLWIELYRPESETGLALTLIEYSGEDKFNLKDMLFALTADSKIEILKFKNQNIIDYYINDTLSALRLIEEVASKGFLLNLDVGTMIWNKEAVEELTGKVHLINHVHISEPNLAPVVAGDFHRRLRRLLEAEAYQGYISIEMGRAAEISRVEEALQSIREAFA